MVQLWVSKNDDFKAPAAGRPWNLEFGERPWNLEFELANWQVSSNTKAKEKEKQDPSYVIMLKLHAALQNAPY
jgi:hypothetical protein